MVPIRFQVPREGLAHPAFAALGPRDDLRVQLWYASAAGDAAATPVPGDLR